MLQQADHFVPREVGPLRAATEPIAPRASDPIQEAVERPVVAGNTEIPVVPQQLPLECDPLLAYRRVPITLAPIGDAAECAPETVSAVFCFTTQYPLRDFTQ